MANNNGPVARISVHEICGDAPLTGTNGIKVHKLILGHWETSGTVEVNFAKVLPSPTFLEQAVGELIGKFPKAELIAKLKLTGLSPADKVLLNGIVVNRYHALVNAEKARNRPQPTLILRKPENK